VRIGAAVIGSGVWFIWSIRLGDVRVVRRAFPLEACEVVDEEVQVHAADFCSIADVIAFVLEDGSRERHRLFEKAGEFCGVGGDGHFAVSSFLA
jgi:hypothetical protein